jgi:hypothetical protein
MTLLEELLENAQVIVPDLCHFTQRDTDGQIAELMHRTSYKPHARHFAEGRMPLSSCDSVRAYRNVVTYLTEPACKDFTVYLQTRGWEKTKEQRTVTNAHGDIVDPNSKHQVAAPVFPLQDIDPLDDVAALRAAKLPPVEGELDEKLLREALARKTIVTDRPETERDDVGSW